MEVDTPVTLDMNKDEELDALKICHQALESVKEVEVLVEQQLTQLKQACEEKERNVAEELMAALDCFAQMEVVEAVEELAIKAAMINEIEKCTGWEREQTVVNCKELKKRMIKLMEKEKEVLSLQRELKLARKAAEETSKTDIEALKRLQREEARFNHTILPGWPWDTSRIIQYGWHMARQWSGRQYVRKGQGLLCFTAGLSVKSGRNNRVLFADEVGTVVGVMPLREPEDVPSWIQFTAAVDLWLSCGTHVWMVNGPRSCDDVSWNRINQRARTHILGYLDDLADFVHQWHDLLSEDIGVLKASIAYLRVGLVEDPRKWWEVPRAMELYDLLQGNLWNTVFIWSRSK
ncbi:unnamed protein product [Haemonchus placei]|uniref:Kinetochore protein Spc24 n=1 Tax=Haemonchus placei TaxID=6290 RepID=A0A158QMH7_HAEPC|nr:unnamed protein product [Haemonchus placei]